MFPAIVYCTHSLSGANCLSHGGATDAQYLLCEQDRIVGISGFTVRSARARREKSRVSAFTLAKIDRIMALEPDMVISFSDLQADIAFVLIKLGANVLLLNHRSIEAILNTVLMLSTLMGATDKGAEPVPDLSQKVTTIHRVANETAG